MKKILLIFCLLALLAVGPLLTSCSQSVEDAFGFERPEDTWITECLLLPKQPVQSSSWTSDGIVYSELFGTGGESGLASEEALRMNGQLNEKGEGWLVCLIYANSGVPKDIDTELETYFRVTYLEDMQVKNGDNLWLGVPSTLGDLYLDHDASKLGENFLSLQCMKDGEIRKPLEDGVLYGAVFVPITVKDQTVNGTLYVDFSVRGIGAVHEILDEQDVVQFGGEDVDANVHIDDFSVRYLSTNDYNNGDYSEDALRDKPSFVNGTGCYMVMDFTMTATGENNGSRFVNVLASVPKRNSIFATIEEAPTGRIEEMVTDDVTTIYAAYGVPQNDGESKTVRMLIRLQPISGGEVEVDLFIMGDAYTALTGDARINVALDTGTAKFGYVLNDDGRSYTLIALTDPSAAEVVIPDKLEDGLPVTGFSKELFRENKRITKVTIGNNVKVIPEGAFSGCTALTDISIGRGVEIIESAAFKGCDALTYNVYENGKYLGSKDSPYVVLMEMIDKNATNFSFPGTTRIIYADALKASMITSLTLPQGVTHIGASAFQGCRNLRSITVPENVISIEYGAFLACSYVNKIYFNAIAIEDKNVGENIFGNTGMSADNLNIYIGPKVTRIPKRLFDGENDAVWNVQVHFAENGVCEELGEGAFLENWYSSFIIPVSVKKIGFCAFFWSVPENNFYLTFAGTMEQWKAISWGGYYDHGTLRVECSDGTITIQG